MPAGWTTGLRKSTMEWRRSGESGGWLPREEATSRFFGKAIWRARKRTDHTRLSAKLEEGGVGEHATSGYEHVHTIDSAYLLIFIESYAALQGNNHKLLRSRIASITIVRRLPENLQLRLEAQIYS